MKLILILLVGCLLGTCMWNQKTKRFIDAQTSEMCSEYATRNHEKEIAPARYAWLGKSFVDNYNWYASCINHIQYPVQNLKNTFNSN